MTIVLSTDRDGEIDNYSSKAKAFAAAKKLAQELNQTVYVAQTTDSEGDIDLGNFSPK
jgi:hypothetical protein